MMSWTIWWGTHKNMTKSRKCTNLGFSPILIGTLQWRRGSLSHYLALDGEFTNFTHFMIVQLHIHGLAVKLKNNNHLQENLRFARNSRIWVDLIRVLQWGENIFILLLALHHNLENRHKNKNSTLIRMRVIFTLIRWYPSRGG